MNSGLWAGLLLLRSQETGVMRRSHPYFSRPSQHIFCGMVSVALSGTVLGSTTVAQANEALIFAVENNTSTPLLEFYATPVTTDDWGDDLLGDSAIPPASALQITLDNPPGDCLYDVIGIFGEGEDDYVEEYEVDLCDLQGGTYAFFDAEDHVFRVENQTQTPISGFYFTLAAEESWGGNLFEASGYVLQPGEFVDVPVDASECEYDFRAVFADGSVDEESTNVCDGTPGVTFVED